MKTLAFTTVWLQRVSFRPFVLACLLILSGCTNYLFYPMKDIVVTPDAIGVSYEDIFVETADHLRLHGWRLFGTKDPLATVLYFHGNAENISTHFGNVYWLVSQGYEVFLFDYRGYGQSEGVAELDAIIADMDLLIGYTVNAMPAGNKKLIVMGQSLGASLSIYSVAHSDYRDRLAALISVSGFSDYHDIAQDALASSWVFWLFQWPLSKTIDNSYSPIGSVGMIAPVPLVVMHSEDDEIIAFYHATRIYDAALTPKSLVRLEGGHNVTFNSKGNRQKLLEVLESVREKEGEK